MQSLKRRVGVIPRLAALCTLLGVCGVSALDGAEPREGDSPQAAAAPAADAKVQRAAYEGLRREVRRLQQEVDALARRIESLAPPVVAPPDDEASLRRASVDGKYAKLLRKIVVPDDEAANGKFCDWGYYTGTSWRGHSELPPGYWVYVAPCWYIWGESRERPEPGKRSWAPAQATGAPDTPSAGDRTTAWASLTPDQQDEWLLLDYARPVRAVLVKVYETYNPGAVSKISGFTETGEEVEMWSGKDPTSPDKEMGVSEIELQKPLVTRRIKLYLNSRETPGWNEIDAVGLVDDAGKVQWAVVGHRQ
jgi:hypothetical protein